MALGGDEFSASGIGLYTVVDGHCVGEMLGTMGDLDALKKTKISVTPEIRNNFPVAQAVAMPADLSLKVLTLKFCIYPPFMFMSSKIFADETIISLHRKLPRLFNKSTAFMSVFKYFIPV